MADTITIGTAPTGANATPDPKVDPAITGDGHRVTVNTDALAEPKKEEPKLILGKFKDQAALEAAYTELEQKQSKAATPPAEKKEEKAAPTGETAPLNFEAIGKEYVDNNGQLSKATLDGLAKQGITKEAVDAYIYGLQAQARDDRTKLVAVVGSEQDLNTLYDWAKANLTPADIRSYNDLVRGPGRNIDAAIMLDSFVSKYNAALGSDPARTVTAGNSPASTGAVPFADQHEMTKAMGDPRYAVSEAYRAEVYARMAVTPMSGVRDVTRR